MKIRIISRLSILMETVEMLYKYVNNLSLDNIKRDFLLKYGEQLSAEDRAYYDTLFTPWIPSSKREPGIWTEMIPGCNIISEICSRRGAGSGSVWLR